MRYTRPLPTAEHLNVLYTHEYYGDTAPQVLSWDSLRSLLHQITLWHRRTALLGRTSGRILDIGCGDDDFLISLKHRGWEVYGTEFSDAACARVRAKGVHVYHGDLAGANFPDRFFDVVTLWHVLEHLSEPRHDLREVWRILRDDGLLVVEVPNSNSPTFSLCKERWFPLDVPRHLQHFTSSTLVSMLEREGFAPIHRKSFHHLDFALAFISVMDRLNILGRLSGVHFFIPDFRRATLKRKALFLLLGVLVGVFSIPYSLATNLLSGNGELITVISRKLASPPAGNW